MKRSKRQALFNILAVLAGLASFVVLVPAQSGSPIQSGIVINRRPLKDFGYYVKGQIESKSVDLNAPFSIELTGKLDKSGKLDPATAKYTKTEGDKAIVEVVKKAIESINDAGYFAYLSEMGSGSSSEIVIHAAQDESGFIASINVGFPSESQARTIANMLNTAVSAAKLVKSPQDSSGKDDILLLGSLAALSEGKSVIIRLNLSKSALREMIERKLAEPQSK